MDNLIALFSFIAITAVAAERFTDIVKRSVYDRFHNVPGYVYQLTSGLFGAFLVYMSPPKLPLLDFTPMVSAVLIGFAVSGGSSVWNEALGLLRDYRNSKTGK